MLSTGCDPCKDPSSCFSSVRLLHRVIVGQRQSTERGPGDTVRRHTRRGDRAFAGMLIVPRDDHTSKNVMCILLAGSFPCFVRDTFSEHGEISNTFQGVFDCLRQGASAK